MVIHMLIGDEVFVCGDGTMKIRNKLLLADAGGRRYIKSVYWVDKRFRSLGDVQKWSGGLDR